VKKIIFITVRKQRALTPISNFTIDTQVQERESRLIDSFEVFSELQQRLNDESLEKRTIAEKELATLEQQLADARASITNPRRPNRSFISERNRLLSQIATKSKELAALRLRSRSELRQEFIDVITQGTEGVKLTQAEAEFAADSFIDGGLSKATLVIAAENAVAELEGTTVGNTQFTATASIEQPPTFEDIQLTESNLQELQTAAHRPGHPPGDTGEDLGDLYNEYKFTENKPIFASLRVLKPIRERNRTSVLPVESSLEAELNRFSRKDPTFETLFETNEFLLQASNEQQNEKFQIMETFGEPVIFTFGERQKIFSYAGALFNSNNFPWRDRFLEKYEEILRASQTIKNGARVYLTYDGLIREGHILNLAIEHSERNLNHVVFSFNMFITRLIPIGGIESSSTDFDTNRARTFNAQRAEDKEGFDIVFRPANVLTLSDIPQIARFDRAGSDLAAAQSLVNEDFRAFIQSAMVEKDGSLRKTVFPFTARDLYRNTDSNSLFTVFPNMKGVQSGSR